MVTLNEEMITNDSKHPLKKQKWDKLVYHQSSKVVVYISSIHNNINMQAGDTSILMHSLSMETKPTLMLW